MLTTGTGSWWWGPLGWLSAAVRELEALACVVLGPEGET